MAKLTWELQDETFTRELDQSDIKIGRGEDNDLQILEESISRNHAKITWDGNQYILEDLDSFNGTFVDEEEVEEKELSGSHVIHLGRQQIQFEPTIEADEPNQDDLNISLTSEAQQEQMQQESDYLSILMETSQILQNELELQSLLPPLVDKLRDDFEADHLHIFLKDEGTNELNPVYTDEKNVIKEISSSVLTHVLDNQQGVVLEDPEKDEFDPGESIAQLEIQSAMCVPLWIEDEVIGLIYMDSRSPTTTYDKNDLRLLLAIANQAAAAIQRAQLHEELTDQTKIRSDLERYLSPDIVETVIDRDSEIQLGGENKLVTVMISDIREFTSLTEHLRPKKVVDKLNEYFEAMTEIIFEHNGTLDKFMGDAILAVFGAPFSHGDDAMNAVNAAYEMQQKMNHLNTFWEESEEKGFEMGIGLHTGTVVAGNIGSPQRMEFTVVGDTVNTASRLESLAGSGDIIVSHSTWDQVKYYYEGTGLGAQDLKGKEEKVQVFQIKDKKEE